MACRFVRASDDQWKCQRCGRQIKNPPAWPVYAACPAEPQGQPTVASEVLCQLAPIPDTTDCRCLNCGTVFHDAQPEELRVRCAKEGLGQPPLVRRWLNFGQALGRHMLDVTAKTAQGRLSEAYRTPEEIDHIFTTHCQPCPFFNGAICTHSKCGCNLGGHEKFLNKLKWKSERCPDEPPRWT